MLFRVLHRALGVRWLIKERACFRLLGNVRIIIISVWVSRVKKLIFKTDEYAVCDVPATRRTLRVFKLIAMNDRWRLYFENVIPLRHIRNTDTYTLSRVP